MTVHPKIDLYSLSDVQISHKVIGVNREDESENSKIEKVLYNIVSDAEYQSHF